MHVLLPPSEAKRPGGRGRSLRTRQQAASTEASDGRPDPLGAARRNAVDALLRLVSGDPDAAARALLLPAGVADEALRADARVLDSPTMPALRRYAGVVYDGLDLARLDPDEQRTAMRTVHVFSGLFGVLRADEQVPEYRVPAKAVLPGIGVAATFWRPVLTAALAATLRRDLIVDLRSSDYSAMWRPDAQTARRVVRVRILSPVPRGGFGVVSYTSKLAKGQLAAALIRRVAAGRPVETARDVAAAWATCDSSDGGRTVTGAVGSTAAELELRTR